MLRWLGNALIIGTAVQALEWCVAYQRKTGGAWRDSEMGRHLMTFMAAISAVLLLSAAHVIAVLAGEPDPPWFRALRLVTFIAVPLVIGWRRHILTKVQSATREAE